MTDGTSSPLPCGGERRAGETPTWLAVLALFLVGLNLRPAVSGIGPVLAAIQSTTGLTASGAGLLTTLPVLCFGLFAPLSPPLAKRFGVQHTILFSMLLLAAAIGLRLFLGRFGLFAGTLIAGAAIGVIMVLLPGMIKRDFREQAHTMMGVYSMALCLGAALSAGLTVPLAELSGSWQLALAFWLLPVLLAAAVWCLQKRRDAESADAKPDHDRTGPDRSSHARPGRITSVWTNALAWQLTAFMGLQSLQAYCVFAWLPTILIDRGMSPLAAGTMLSLSIGMQLITAMAGPWLAGFGRDQRMVITITMLAGIAGFAGCVYGSQSQVWIWAVLLGLGQGGSFSIALTLIVLRASNAVVAASLSGMVQGVGYTVAALGPLAFGLLHDLSGNWHAATVLFIATGGLALLGGLGAGRNRLVQARTE